MVDMKSDIFGRANVSFLAHKFAFCIFVILRDCDAFSITFSFDNFDSPKIECTLSFKMGSSIDSTKTFKE